MMDIHRFSQTGSSSDISTAGENNDSDGSSKSNKTWAAQQYPAAVLENDDTFDKIEMDFDAIMANDLESTDPVTMMAPLKSSSGIDTNSADILFEKIFPNSNNNSNNNINLGDDPSSLTTSKGMASFGLYPEGNISKMGISSKLGDIGDDLNIDPLDDVDIIDLSKANNNVPLVSSHGSISNRGSVSSRSSFEALGLHNQQAPALMEGGDSNLSMNHLFKSSFRSVTSGKSSGSSNNWSNNSIEKLLDGSENSFDKFLSMDLIDDQFTTSPTAADANTNANANTDATSFTNTASINLSLKNSSTFGSLGSLASVETANLVPNASFHAVGDGPATHGQQATQIGAQAANPASANANANTPVASAQQQQQQQQQAQQQQQQQHAASVAAADVTRQQQQHAIMLQRQNQLFLKQQQQQQQHIQQQQQQLQQPGNNNNTSSIPGIVNSHLSRLPQTNEMTQMTIAGLQQEKFKLFQRLQEIERSQTQPQPQQFLYQQQQGHHQQQQLLLQQQQFQQQQQQSMVSADQVKSGQRLQGQHQQQTPFALSQQFQQQQQMDLTHLSPTPIAITPSPTPFSANAINNNNNNNNNNSSSRSTSNTLMPSSMFASTAPNNNTLCTNISSVMGSGIKETPLQRFLRNKGSPQPVAALGTGSISPVNNNNNGNGANSILDATPLGPTSSNPSLRKQMMADLDRSVSGRNVSARGGMFGSRSSALSSSIRQSMAQRLGSVANQRRKPRCLDGRSEHGTSSTVDGGGGSILQQSTSATDFYESAGIRSRHVSADHLMGSRIGASAAKARNRQVTLSRSHSSGFGMQDKTKSGVAPKRDHVKVHLRKQGISNRSLGSIDSLGSLVPAKRGNNVGGRGGFGAKYKLGSSTGSIHHHLAQRNHSSPFMIQGGSGSASKTQLQQHQQKDESSNSNMRWH